VGIKDDMTNAGATWVDEALVIDGNQIASRTPKDLAVFSKALVDMLD
jgi:protease I